MRIFKNRKREKFEKARATALCLCVGAGATALMPNFVYADAFSKAAKGAADGIQVSAADASKYLLIIALVVIGLSVAFGTRNQKEGAKERIPALGIGLGVVLGASSLATLIFGWFY